MAEINMPQKGGRRKTQPPRLDLTPMVDLGFILITFFIFTTTLAKSNMMDIRMPSNEPTEIRTVVIEESVITLIPVKDHKIAWYTGALTREEQIKVCPIGGIRSVLLNKKKQVAGLPASFSRSAHRVTVLIKPNDDCKYEDVVSLLDEMLIVGVPDYTIMDVAPEEKSMIAKKY